MWTGSVFVVAVQLLFRRLRVATGVLPLLGSVLALTACYGNDPRFAPVPPSIPTASAAASTAPALPFEEAVTAAVDALFASIQLPHPSPPNRYLLIVDPLVDGVTGARSVATASMEALISTRVRERHADQFDLAPISTAALARSPLVLLGSFTGIGPGGRTLGPPEAYRIWLVLADLRSGRIVARGVARALPARVDTTPARFEHDSPLWLAADHATRAYLRTCEGKVGDAVDPAYVDGVFASALVADAMAAYDRKHYRDALDLFEAALRTPGGNQLRTHAGRYLANKALGNGAAAEEAFGQAVNFGLRHGRLAVKLLFRPGSTLFWPDPAVSGDYPMWLRQMARHIAAGPACLRLTGHTSATGPTLVNDRLSLARADYVRAQLAEAVPSLAPRIETRGRGSREVLLGTGRDDATDLLDRRVEFELITCEGVSAASGKVPDGLGG
jgi:outer membrane protein OmpA-like peptidoglycan-associated protein